MTKASRGTHAHASNPAWSSLWTWPLWTWPGEGCWIAAVRQTLPRQCGRRRPLLQARGLLSPPRAHNSCLTAHKTHNLAGRWRGSTPDFWPALPLSNNDIPDLCQHRNSSWRHDIHTYFTVKTKMQCSHTDAYLVQTLGRGRAGYGWVGATHLMDATALGSTLSKESPASRTPAPPSLGPRQRLPRVTHQSQVYPILSVFVRRSHNTRGATRTRRLTGR